MTVPADLRNGLLEAYEKTGAHAAEILYIYTDFRHFGTFAAQCANREEFCRAFVDPFLDAGKTIVMTTFSYTSEGRFDVDKTGTNLGVMNKWILRQAGMRRSEHPIFSYAALGPQAGLVENVGKSAFGASSVFERLRGKKTAFLHVGRPVHMGNTALHYIEHMGGATYRMHKAFKTEVFREGQFIGTDYTAFLRRRDVPGESFAFDFTKAARKLHESGLIRQVGSDHDLSNISFYWYDQTLDAMHSMFNEDQRIFIQSDFIGY